MTGPEHYAEAERLLDETRGEHEVTESMLSAFQAQLQQMMTRAQVHAMLALAAATALGREGGDGRMPARDRAAWFNVAAVPPAPGREG